MKVTALLPDDIIEELKKLNEGMDISQIIEIALQDYIKRQRIRKAIAKVKTTPLKFRKDFTARGVRALNRRR